MFLKTIVQSKLDVKKKKKKCLVDVYGIMPFKWNDRSVFSTGAIRKNPATQDATDEAVQVNVTRYLKGASDREGGKRRRTAERDPQPTP